MWQRINKPEPSVQRIEGFRAEEEIESDKSVAGYSMIDLINATQQMNATPREAGAARLEGLSHKHGGTILAPGSATHMHEVHLLGIYANGDSLEHAAVNWLDVANRLISYMIEDVA